MKAAVLHPEQGSREATPSSGKKAPFDVTVHITKEGVKGEKRCKQLPQGITTDHDDGNNGEAGGSNAWRVSTTAHSDKR
jgi:hypothetical protein